ncbi:hypothetical protein OAJ65_01150 [Flavobacteriales bacterium]|nr:hypothetical protein [Flavobacteriales bacterium]
MTLAQKTYVPDDSFEAYLEIFGMGDGVGNNDSVLTANINTLWGMNLSFPLLANHPPISDLTGIEDFDSIQMLWCWDNQLTTLDVSQNTALTELICTGNQLTSLDVSQNTALDTLWCQNNQITSLDVSQNTALIALYCQDNQLTSLDVSNNTLLEQLNCTDNYIECLDVSGATALTYLQCGDNLLEQLNTKNGNWQNMTVVANDNNLTCVEVDNLGQATNNWTFDSFTSITTDCNYASPCATVSAIEEHTTNKELLKVTDLLGRETKGKKNQPLFYIYDEGTVEKRIVIE